jgi:hypothetical protein
MEEVYFSLEVILENIYLLMFINYIAKSCSEPVKCIVSLFKTQIILETEGVFSWAVLTMIDSIVNHILGS